MRSEKSEFSRDLAQRLGIPQAVAVQAVDTVFELLADRLRSQGRAAIWGVGSFEVVPVRVPKHWLTPRNGVVVQRREPKSVRFRPSKVFRDRID